MRTLVVDDSKSMRMLIGQILEGLGFEVVEGCHGLEGLERLKDSGSFEVAFVDWNMPEMNGYEFVCAARADAAYNSMQLVMVTTESEISKMVKALEAGANEYIMKPFTKEIIQEKLLLLDVGQK